MCKEGRMSNGKELNREGKLVQLEGAAGGRTKSVQYFPNHFTGYNQLNDFSRGSVRGV